MGEEAQVNKTPGEKFKTTDQAGSKLNCIMESQSIPRILEWWIISVHILLSNIGWE